MSQGVLRALPDVSGVILGSFKGSKAASKGFRGVRGASGRFRGVQIKCILGTFQVCYKEC